MVSRQLKSTINKSLNFKAGAATLPTIFIFIVLIIVVGLGITALGLTESFIAAGAAQSSRALTYAEAGAKDALERIARNKIYICATADCYSIDFVTSGCANNDGCARITVSAGVGSSADPKIITSKGQVKSNIRKIQVDVVFDASLNGEISSAAWREI